MIDRKKAAVLGGGSWGTSISKILSEKFDTVWVWDIDTVNVKLVEATRENKKYLSGRFLQRNIHFSTDIKEVISDSSVVLFVFPSKFVRATARKIKNLLQNSQIIVNLIKGLEENSLKRVSEIVKEELGPVPYAVLSGPSHAEEVAMRMPTAVVCASNDSALSLELQTVFVTENFRVYTSTDVVGVELGGSLKNVIAIAAGISDGLGFGSNTKSAIMTRGLTEMMRFSKTAKQATFMGLSGIGDLITTCISPYSRNRKFGEWLGRGYSFAEAIGKMTMVVEGINTTKGLYSFCKKRNIDMPITIGVYDIMFNSKKPIGIVKRLMLRELKPEKSNLSLGPCKRSKNKIGGDSNDKDGFN